MALPEINTYSINENEIIIRWKSNPQKDGVIQWKVYGTKDVTIDFVAGTGVVLPGTLPNKFTYLKTIPNTPHYMTPGSVSATFSRTYLGLGQYDPYYFIITGVDINGVESAMEVDNVHVCPWNDNRFIDETGWPANIIYKSFYLDIPLSLAWDVDRKLNVISLMGRPARQIKILLDKLDTVGVKVKFNAFANDEILITNSTMMAGVLDLKRTEIEVDTIYFFGSGFKFQLYISG